MGAERRLSRQAAGGAERATRQRLGAPKRLAYGPTPIEALDVFASKRPNAPINVYVHGGAWRAGLAKDYAFLAEVFVNAGAHFIALDFISVRDQGRSDADGQQIRAGRLGL